MIESDFTNVNLWDDPQLIIYPDQTMKKFVKQY